ncbi:MAG TPA: hypothetical protein VG935_03060 [Patescibacteria group bacterium]|nr:hypothetical protein [Patescibacteria group bacterium]
MNDSLQQLISFLQSKSATPEQIATECENVTWQAAEEFYDQLRMVLTEEDNKIIDAIEDDAQAEEEIKRRYETKTGLNSQELMTALLNKHVQTIIDEYNSPEQVTAQ